MARVEQSGVERQLRQEEIDNREANWRRDWQEWNHNQSGNPENLVEFDQLITDFERYGGDWDDAVIDQWDTDDGHSVQRIDGDGDGKADVTRVLLADGTVQYRYDSDGDGKANRVVVPGHGILTVHTDSDGDGTFDTVEVRDTAGNVLSHTVHADTDGDGAVDQATATTSEGVTIHTDSDGDGAFDTVEVRNGEGNVLSHTVHADTDGDGAIDQATVTTPEGVTVRTDSDGDGAFDQLEVRDAEGNILSHTVHADTDGDGAVDQVEVRDAEGNVLSHTVHADTDGDGAVDQVTATTPEGVTVHTDSDGDGAFDTVEVRDAEGSVLTHTVHADTDGDGAIDQATVTTPEGVRVHTDLGDGLNLVDMTGSSIQAQVEHHNSISERVQTLVEGHNTQIQSFQQRMAQYERDVAAFNGATGARDTKEQERLVAERGALEQLGSDINGRGEIVRQAAEWVSANAGQINDRIEVANLDFNMHFWNVQYRGKDWGMHTTSDGREIALPDEYKKYWNDYVALGPTQGSWGNDYVSGLRQLQEARQFTNENVTKLHDLLSEHRDAGHSAREWKFTFVDGEFKGRHSDNDGPVGGASDVSYTVNDDGTVKKEQDGHTYTVNDEDLANDVRNAAATGDVSSLSSVDQVTVLSGDDLPPDVTYTVNSDGTVQKQQDGHTYTVNDEDLANDVRNAVATGDVSSLSSVDQVTVLSGDDLPPDVTYTVNSDGTVQKQQDGHTYTVNDEDLANDVRNAAATGDASSLSSVDQVAVLSADDLAPDVTYTVNPDGTVQKHQDGHTYTVNDEDLAQDVRDAAASGDATGLSSVDQVTVWGNLPQDPTGTLPTPPPPPSLHIHSPTKTQIARTNEFAKAWAATDVTSKASTDALKAQFPEYSKGIDDAIVSAYLNHIAGDEETLPPSPDVAQATLAAQVSQERADFNRAFKEFTGQEATGDMATDRSFVQNLMKQVEESDGFEGPARAIRPDPEQTTASAELNRFRNEVAAAYAAPDVVDDEGFSTNVNAHQHTKGTLEQLKSQYADDPAKTAFLDGAIKQLDVHYDLHSLGTDARAGKAVAVLAEQERRNLQAQAVELGKVGTLEDIAQESGLAGTTEYRVWLADEKKYATLTGREMQDMGVSNVLHDPWSQEARDLAAQGQNVLVERAVEPAAAEVKDDPGKAAAMANFAQHMLQFAAADSGGASTVVSMMKSAEELAKESPAFAALPTDEQRKLLDHYDNPVKNPYTRAAVLAAASGMAGSIASGTAFGSTLLGQAALGVPFAAADVGGTYLDTGKVTWKDGARAAFFESLPFIPDVGTSVWKGGKHGVRSFATGGDFTDWAHGNVDSTLRINLEDLSKSIPEGFTPQGGSIADNAVFAYGSPGGLKPKTVTEIQQEFGQSVQAQLFDLAGDNPGKTVSVRLPDGRFITYTPPRAAALQSSGNPLVFAASPDVGFVKDGSYVTMPLPLEKIDEAPVETSHFGSLIGPLKRFRRSSAFNVAGGSGSRGPIARAVFGEPSNPGVIAFSKFDAAGAPNVALSGKVYQPAHGPPVIEIEGVKDINLPTAVPYQYGIGMPQVRSGQADW